LSGGANPEFHGLLVWHVDDKLFFILVINGFCLNIFHIAAMTKLGQSEAADVLQIQGSLEEILMKFTVFPSKIVDSFSIQEDGDVVFNTEAWVKIICGMSSDSQRMRVGQIVGRLEGSEFMVSENHLSCFLSLLFSLIFFNIGMLKDVSIFYYDVKALIGQVGILLSVNEIPNLFSANWMLLSPFMKEVGIWVNELGLNRLKSY
jgi:hypothetical protein